MTQRTLALAGALVGLLLVGAAPAAAEEQPPILKAYGLDWIERVREEAWPQPKAQRPIICLLDTGVAITPDTPADDPNGPIVARLAVEDVVGQPPEPGSGLPQGVTFQHMHGTQMASVIAAPRNGYGTVGVFPQARIVSVRVTLGKDVFITPADMDSGVRLCRAWALERGVSMSVVVMAESGYDSRPVEIDRWQVAAAVAAGAGGIFVAAAGNAEGANLVAPVAATDVIAVGAGDDGGARCESAPTLVRVAMVGPGCSSLPGPRWPRGSSSATAAVGALAGALAMRVPTMPAPSRRSAVRASVVGSPDGVPRLDGTRILDRFAGLVHQPGVPVSNTGLVVAPESSPDSDSAGTLPPLRLWRPSVRLRATRDGIVVRRLRQRAGVLRIRFAGTKAATVRIRGNRGLVRTALRPKRAEVWAESRSPGKWRSLTVRVKVAR